VVLNIDRNQVRRPSRAQIFGGFETGDLASLRHRLPAEFPPGMTSGGIGYQPNLLRDCGNEAVPTIPFAFGLPQEFSKVKLGENHSTTGTFPLKIKL
jgi:hypothetical protein